MNYSLKPLLSLALISLLAIGLLSSKAKAAVLLLIDVSNPSAVVVTATTNPSTQTATDEFIGLTLTGFYATIPTEGPSGVGLDTTLVSTENGELYHNAENSSNHLLIFSFFGAHEFVAGNQAFSGSLTFDLSDHTSHLPTSGSTGSIVFSDNSVPALGEWIIVPEPSSAALLGLGCLSLIFRRSRR